MEWVFEHFGEEVDVKNALCFGVIECDVCFHFFSEAHVYDGDIEGIVFVSVEDVDLVNSLVSAYDISGAGVPYDWFDKAIFLDDCFESSFGFFVDGSGVIVGEFEGGPGYSFNFELLEGG